MALRSSWARGTIETIGLTDRIRSAASRRARPRQQRQGPVQRFDRGRRPGTFEDMADLVRLGHCLDTLHWRRLLDGYEEPTLAPERREALDEYVARRRAEYARAAPGRGGRRAGAS